MWEVDLTARSTFLAVSLQLDLRKFDSDRGSSLKNR